ncbi:MAG TPA: molybdenum cofactor guanylyltransferase [Bacteroidia bacterium]|nr:molybdenum cofactor guanylyltransferase [Bacteroidia bacterium]
MNAIILAGGKATRLNGISKGLLTFQNQPLIEIIIKNISPFAKKIIISANTNDYDYLKLPIIKDKIKDIGPIAGLVSGLEYSDEEMNLIVSCDSPFVSQQIIEKLILNTQSVNCIIPKIKENIQPLCAIYFKSILPIAYSQINKKDFKLQHLIQQSKAMFVEFPEEYKLFFANINTKEDVEQFLQSNK